MIISMDKLGDWFDAAHALLHRLANASADPFTKDLVAKLDAAHEALLHHNARAAYEAFWNAYGKEPWFVSVAIDTDGLLVTVSTDPPKGKFGDEFMGVPIKFERKP